MSKNWVITVGGDYGAFLFEGSREEAEEMRRHKARWEGELACKRRATPSEVAANSVDHNLPAREVFQEGDVWMSPCGFLYRVMGVNAVTGQAYLRKGANGSGRKQFRNLGNTYGWKLEVPHD